MKIVADSVVAFDYHLYDELGELIDEGAGEDAMVYLHGHEQMLPGLERALEGKSAGERLEVTIPPEDAYGERTEQEEVRIPRGELPADIELEPGAELAAEGPDGQSETFWVVAVENGWVVLTRDHPLSGLTLRFDVTVREVRAATPAELHHGHAHGAGGEDHHH
jgi:FKBP-type peptidyl-prolyl cis-trans isomerase SlyD